MKHQYALLLIAFFWLGCGNNEQPKETSSNDTLIAREKPVETKNAISQQDSITATGQEILFHLKAQNYSELVKYFSQEGVLFSPYGYIDIPKSKKINPDEFLEAVQKKWILTWGSADGTGEPIKLTVKDYLKKYGYTADYLNAEAVGFDEVIKSGNSVNNLKSIYPNHHFIDYHFSGFDQKLNGMDWSSLRLVFEKQDGQYFLVALIHDQWTI